jgi:hypothetical protein
MQVAAILAAVAMPSAVPSAASPALAIAVHVRPADREALRRAVESSQASQLKEWRAQGLVTGFRLLFARYPDSSQWDAFELLHFRDEAALARWRKAASEPFVAEVLAVAQSIETTPGEVVRAEGGKSPHPAVLVIPYEVLVPAAEYASYLDGYTIPQFKSWMNAGVLDGYDIVMSSYPAGRPWGALITLRYRDDAALQRRDEVVQETRSALASNRAWKELADSKKNVRSEHALAVADEIASEGDVQ